MRNKIITIVIVATLIGAYSLFSVAYNNKIEHDIAALQQTEKPRFKTEGKVLGDVTEIRKEMRQDHSRMNLDCKNCHACEFPTKNDPCLLTCPRPESVQMALTSKEGPNILNINDIEGEFGSVVFSHKMHADMSEMSGGCSSCHHYNTSNKVIPCKDCHSNTRKREDLQIPDLTAAYHRQCLDCHRQWSGGLECKSCHISSPAEAAKLAKEMEITNKSKVHPQVQQPNKIVYETTNNNGRFVTFFHDDHTRLFGGSCQDCHQNQSCSKCHDVKLKSLRGTERPNLTLKANKTFEEHHQPCVKCHQQDQCAKCHQSSPLDQFNHAKSTGFDLTKYHSNLTCSNCHKTKNKFSGLSSNCTSCHSNFKTGKFDHKRTGLALDEIHADMECSDCHKDAKFSKSFNCIDCHDDKNFPKFLPGKRIRR